MLISKSLEDFSILFDFSVYLLILLVDIKALGILSTLQFLLVVFVKGLWCFVEKQTNLILLQLSLLEP